MKIDPLFTPFTNINSKCFIDFNIRAKTIKLSEEATGAECDFALSNAFLDATPKATK